MVTGFEEEFTISKHARFGNVVFKFGCFLLFIVYKFQCVTLCLGYRLFKCEILVVFFLSCGTLLNSFTSLLSLL